MASIAQPHCVRRVLGYDRSFRAEACREVGSATEESLRALRIRDDEGFHLGRLLACSRKYTMLHRSGDSLVETHSDFCKKGQTEHILWLQHKLGLANYTQLSVPPAKRALHPKRTVGVGWGGAGFLLFVLSSSFWVCIRDTCRPRAKLVGATHPRSDVRHRHNSNSRPR